METEKAILAGGCFWGMEELFRQQIGVVSARVGYTGGDFQNPTYEHLKTGKTGHAEAIEIIFDPEKTSYQKILEFFFQIHDPTTKNRQGNDIGTQYRSAIFYLGQEQKRVAEELMARLNASNRFPAKIVTELAPAGIFYEAETYHQKYLARYPDGYTCHFIRPDWKI